MVGTQNTAFAPALGLAAVFGLSSMATATELPGFISLPLTKGSYGHSLNKRDDLSSLPLELSFDNSSFLIDVEIGSPKQKVKLALDIGTFGTWAIESCEDVFFREEECKKLGTYNDTASDSGEYYGAYYYDEEDYYFDRQDGDSHRLSFVSDDFTIAGAGTLKNVTFGSYDFPRSLRYGTLGLGFGKDVNTNGTSMMDNLVDQGIIDTKSFGITLGGSDDENEGSLALGGVDTKKYSGALTKLPIEDPPTYPFDYEEYRYWIKADSVTFDDGEGNKTEGKGFTFHPQTVEEINYLPIEIVDTVALAFGVTNTSMDQEYGSHEWYMVDCLWKDMVNGSLALHFGDLTVDIPYGEFVNKGDIRDTGHEECYISTIPRSQQDAVDAGIWYFGHTFLRAVYAVFDQDEKAVWIANREDCGSEVVAFSKGSDHEGQCDGNGVSGGNSDGDRNGGSGDDDESDDSAGVERRASVALVGLASVACAVVGWL